MDKVIECIFLVWYWLQKSDAMHRAVFVANIISSWRKSQKKAKKVEMADQSPEVMFMVRIL